MILPYKTRRGLKRLGVFLLSAALILALVWVVWLLWLDRYVVYSDEGARLDFSLSKDFPNAQIATEPTGSPISIYYNEGNNAIDTSTELAQMNGYYISIDMLRNEIDLVWDMVRNMPAGSSVLIDLKDTAGRFYYDTSLSSHITSSIDSDVMNQLLTHLRTGNYYLIARVPAFQDYYFGLENVPYGLPTSKGYLWFSDERTYWLNPASEGTLAFLIQIAAEIRTLGFDELVFTDFCFPDTDKISFKGSKQGALEDAAKRLAEVCATESFAVSFATTDAAFPLPEGRCRLYLENKDAAKAATLAAETGIEDTAVRLVFLTEFNDTRFDLYSVLRPITNASFEEIE